jgi:glycosyltransferase involved in cell wall biosynthesis
MPEMKTKKPGTSSSFQATIVSELRGSRLDGVGRYIREIISHVDIEKSGVDLRILCGGHEIPITEWSSKNLQEMQHPTLPHKVIRKVRRYLIQRHSRSSVFHYPRGYLPEDWKTGSHRKIITLHGAARLSDSHWVLPRGKKSGELLKTRLQLNSTDLARVITVSAFSKEEVISAFHLRPEQVEIIPSGVNLNLFRPLVKKDVLPWLRAIGIHSPYILYAGSSTPRKNVLRLIHAFVYLKAQSGFFHKLVLTGPEGPLSQIVKREINNLALNDDVIITGPVKDDMLVRLYNGASAFVFPSLYEGFGLPVLEAMACGTPVVTSNRTAMPETAGEAAALINDPTNREDIANVVQGVLENTSYQDSLRIKGLERVRNFTWEKCATAHLELYQMVAEEGR